MVIIPLSSRSSLSTSLPHIVLYLCSVDSLLALAFLYSLSVSVVPFTEYVAIKLVPVSVRDETPSIHTNTNTIRIPTRADCLQFFSSQTT